MDAHFWWYVTRASAMIAWGLMTLSVLWGILLSTRILRHVDNPAWLQDLHRYFGGSAIVMVALHMVSLMLDGWLSMTLPEVLIPFVSEYRAVPVALGVIAFYLLVTVQLTSLMMARMPRRAWKAIHYTTYATLILVSFHAGLSGTDVGSTWYQVASIGLITVTVSAVLLRILAGSKSRATAGTTPRTDAPRTTAILSPTPTRTPELVGASTTSMLAVARSLPPLPVAPPRPIERREMVVSEVRREAEGVISVRLLPLGGGTLLAWYPGAHITLHLPTGLQRQYSLCGDPADRGHYDIAVLRTADSAGGSRWIHENLRAGMTLVVDGPLNHFELESANQYLFIAGGIGITPLKAMIESLPAQRSWRLAYFGRSRTTMPFVTELLTRYPGQVGVFASDECETHEVLQRILLGAQHEVYCCGPASLMDAVARVVPRERLHLERFIPVVREAQTAPHSVRITALRSEREVEVAAGENVLAALEAEGLPVTGSCRKGVCGSCEVRVLSGTPEHLDSVMDDTDKDDLGVMYPCVSHSRSTELVLDL